MYGTVAFYPGRPTDSHLQRFEGLELDLHNAEKKADEIFKDLTKINSELGNNKIEILKREDFDKEGAPEIKEKKGNFEDED